MLQRALAATDNLQPGPRNRPNRPRRTADPLADLRGVKIQLRQRAAERVAVHPELFGRLALIAAMSNQNFQQKPLLEFTNRVGVADTRGVHLEDEIVEFALHSLGFLFLT